MRLVSVNESLVNESLVSVNASLVNESLVSVNESLVNESLVSVNESLVSVNESLQEKKPAKNDVEVRILSKGV